MFHLNHWLLFLHVFFVALFCLFTLFCAKDLYIHSFYLSLVLHFQLTTSDILPHIIQIKFTVEKCHSPLACETFLAFLLFHHIKQIHLLHLKVRQYHPFRLLAFHMGHIHSLYPISDTGFNELQYIDIVKPVIDGIAA